MVRHLGRIEFLNTAVCATIVSPGPGTTTGERRVRASIFHYGVRTERTKRSDIVCIRFVQCSGTSVVQLVPGT